MKDPSLKKAGSGTAAPVNESSQRRAMRFSLLVNVRTSCCVEHRDSRQEREKKSSCSRLLSIMIACAVINLQQWSRKMFDIGGAEFFQ